MSPAVHQLLPSLEESDEVAQHAVMLRGALRAAGHASEIFVDGDPERPGGIGGAVAVRDYLRQARRGDCLVCHYSPRWPTAVVLPRCDRLVVDYHGEGLVSGPPDQHRDGAPRGLTAPGRRGGGAPRGLSALDRLSRRSILGLVHTPGAAEILLRAGCRKVEVVPLLTKLVAGGRPEPRLAHRLARTREPGAAEWLHIGACHPVSSLEDIVKALWVYRRLYGPARLHLVGRVLDRSYLKALLGMAAGLGLEGAVRVTGEVSPSAQCAYLAAADIYVSLRRDPVVDAGTRAALEGGLPVVGRWELGHQDAPAGMPVGEGGPTHVAAAAHRMIVDGELRRCLADGARRWLAHHEPDADATRVVQALCPEDPGVGDTLSQALCPEDPGVGEAVAGTVAPGDGR